MRKKARKLSKPELLNRQIANWEHKQEAAVIMLRKSAEELMKLRRKRQRMLKRLTDDMKTADDLVASTVETPATQVETFVARGIAAQQAVDEALDDIPSFCDRTAQSRNDSDKDAAARAEIEAEQAAKKKRAAERSAEKRKINAEVRHAELTGKRRKMPLQGKAALAAIREEAAVPRPPK